MSLKSNRAWSGRVKVFVGCCVLLVLTLALAGCGQAAQLKPTATPEYIFFTDTPVPEPTATLLPSLTSTLPPTATLEPTATTPPTQTPVPELAVVQDGFNAWCFPLSYEGYTPAGPVGPADSSALVVKDDLLSVKIPAAFCTLAYSFNQPVPEGTVLTLFDGTSAFMRLPLKPVDGSPDQAWTTVNHTYVVNPPYWEVSYRLVVNGPDGKELWSNVVKFGKPLPEECVFGGLPDPITLYCTKNDPWEIEPWPDVTYPYDRSRLTPGGE